MEKRGKCEVRPPEPELRVERVWSMEPVRFLTQAQVAALFAAAQRGEKRDRVLLAFLYRFGMRASEAAGLRTEDVSLVERTITIRGRKGGLVRSYSIPADVAALMRGYRPGTFWYFPSPRAGYGGITRNRVWQVVKHYARLAGLPAWATVHSLRHSAAVHALDAGLQLEDVRDLLRHRRLATTEIYGVISLKRRGDYQRRLQESDSVVKVK